MGNSETPEGTLTDAQMQQWAEEERSEAEIQDDLLEKLTAGQLQALSTQQLQALMVSTEQQLAKSLDTQYIEDRRLARDLIENGTKQTPRRQRLDELDGDPTENEGVIDQESILSDETDGDLTN